MSDENRVTPKDAKDLIEAQKSLMLEQQKAMEKEARDNREEYVEVKFNVPVSLTGKLADYYAKLMKEWNSADV